MSIFSRSTPSFLHSHYNNFIPQTCALVIYCCIVTASYYYGSNQIMERKNEILKDYHQIILNNSLIKLNYLLQKLPLDQKGIYTSIYIDKSDIQSCYKNRCFKSNLFEFASTIDKQVPSFVYYKIEINKQILHHNIKISNYEFEQNHNINDYNQLSIALSIDSKYWGIVKKGIIYPYVIVIISSSLFLLLFILSTKLLNKYTKNFYFSYYKNNYDLELQKIIMDYQNELASKENTIMRKIWDLEYRYEKDEQINHLFSQEVNKIVLNIEETEEIKTDYQNKLLSYTIPLYYSNKEPEKISVENLKEIFTSRFSKSEDNILFTIISAGQNIEFASRAALYQIIYSIVSYIIFILKEQTNTLQYNIRLNIENNQNNICLLFEFDGFRLEEEKDLAKFSNKFFKKRGNPFLLSINQIFDTLRSDNFLCKLGYNNFNFIEITGHFAIKSISETKSNIIRLPVRK